MSCVEQVVELDLREDMNWSISRSSGLIQLGKLLPLRVLRPKFNGSGCVGNLLNRQHKVFAKCLYQTEPKNVIEIGGAHGILAKEYKHSAIHTGLFWSQSHHLSMDELSA
jgi:hypothetical protein